MTVPTAATAGSSAAPGASSATAEGASVVSRIDICVATYRRPAGLRALLESLAADDFGPHRVRVIVVDNDPSAQVRPDVAVPFPDGLEVVRVVEPTPGIPAARNRALDLVEADWIGFLDDDETVVRGWLDTLLSAATTYAADIVTGPVIADLPDSAPRWVRAGGFHQRRRFPTGIYAGLPATNNTLLSTGLWDRVGRPRFDPAFTESGGEDTDFFDRLRAHGAIVAWVDEAPVHEPVPTDRLRARWLWRRYRRAGNVVARIDGASRMRTTATGLARIGWGTALTAVSPVRRGLPAARGVEQIGRGVGALQAAWGRTVREYTRESVIAPTSRQVPPRSGAVPASLSVVIPVRNGMGTLPEQLAALAQQTYRGPFEVVIADNGSTDGLSLDALAAAGVGVVAGPPPAAEPLTARVSAATDGTAAADVDGSDGMALNVRIVPAGERAGVSHARNTGVAAARGDLILICDADDRVSPRWMADLVSAAADADLVGGSMDTALLNTPVVRSWRQLVAPGELTGTLSFLPFARGCNLAVWRDVVQALGGWDTELVAGGDDVDFSWRAQLAGYELRAITGGSVNYRLNPRLAGMARQVYRYGRADAQLLRRFAAHGARPDSPVRWLKNLAWLVVALPTLRTAQGRGKYVYRGTMLVGRVAGAVRYRVRT